MSDLAKQIELAKQAIDTWPDSVRAAIGVSPRITPPPPAAQSPLYILGDGSHESIAEMLPSMLRNGVTQCPLCAHEDIHTHSPAEIVIYRNGMKYGRSLAAAPQATPKSAHDETAWLVENGKQGGELRYRYFDDVGLCGWTTDPYQAMHFCRRIDAERFCAADEDAWRIVEHMFCAEAPQAPPKNVLFDDLLGARMFWSMKCACDCEGCQELDSAIVRLLNQPAAPQAQAVECSCGNPLCGYDDHFAKQKHEGTPSVERRLALEAAREEGVGVSAIVSPQAQAAEQSVLAPKFKVGDMVIIESQKALGPLAVSKVIPRVMHEYEVVDILWRWHADQLDYADRHAATKESGL